MKLCRKDMMIKNIRKHKRQLQKDKMFVEEDWDFLPLTFFLPSEYIMFAEEFRKKRVYGGFSTKERHNANVIG